jgi:hypothetical protein
MRNKKEWAFLILIAALSLVGLSVYRLVEDKNLSTSEKETLSYIELGLSFVVPLYYIIGSISLLLLTRLHYPLLIVYFLLFLAVSPIGLTSLKLALKDQLTEFQEQVLVGLTIVSTVLITRYEFMFTLGI